MLSFKSSSTEVKFADDDKENDPAVLLKENPGKTRHIPRTRHLSLLDTNRTVSVSEFGGWAEADEEVLINKSRLGSVVDSLNKHRKSSGCWNVGNIEEDVSVLTDSLDEGEMSLRGQDWNDLIDGQIQRSDSPPRARFLTAADSLTKVSWKDDSSTTSDSPEKEELYKTPEVFTEVEESETKSCNTLPEDVVDIDDEDEMSDYGSEIVIYLRRLERNFTLSYDFLENSTVTTSMRSTLVDWLIQVQHHLKLCQETLYLTVSMLDLVLDKRDVDTDKLQLVGITSLFIASKLEEYYPVDLKKLLHLTEESYTMREVLEMELVLVEVLQFQLYIPTPRIFLLRYHAASLHPSCPIFLATSHYLIDSHLPASTNPCIPPSLLAAAATLTSGMLYFITTSPSCPFPSTIWTPTLVFYTGYSIEDLLQTSVSMLSMVQSSAYTGAATKYKSMSQHNRLVLKDHLQMDVVVRARGIMEGWINGSG